jgi:hypothetical protein
VARPHRVVSTLTRSLRSVEFDERLRRTQLLAAAGIPATLPDGSHDRGVIGTEPADLSGALAAFREALAMHRVWERESDPPKV